MSLFRRYHLALVFALLAGSVTGRADERSFSARLPEDQHQAVGLNQLSPQQLATLNNLVQRELLLAKQGDVRAFAAEFSKRRSPPELAKAGIDKLTVEQRTRLDAAVAQEIAHQPREVTSTLTPIRRASAVQAVGPKAQIHGSVSFIAGTSGGGRNFYGGGFEIEHYDPVNNVSIAFSYSELHGKGLYWPYGYGYGYGHDRYGFDGYRGFGRQVGRSGCRY